MFVGCSIHEICYFKTYAQGSVVCRTSHILEDTLSMDTAKGMKWPLYIFATNNQYIHPNKHVDYAGDLAQVENMTQQQPPVR